MRPSATMGWHPPLHLPHTLQVGEFARATTEKLRLEEKQRAVGGGERGEQGLGATGAKKGWDLGWVNLESGKGVLLRSNGWLWPSNRVWH